MALEERDLRHIWHPCSQMKDYEELPPIPIERGRGVCLYDVYGKEYIDIISSWWCNLLGHCNPAVNAAVKEQIERLEHVIFANFTHEPAIRLCEELSEIVPRGLTKFNFSDNGSASVECALKMAFQYQHQTGHPEKTKFICLTEGYHGETIGALSVGCLDLYAKIYKSMLMDVERIQAPDCYRCPCGRERGNCSVECFAFAERLFEEHAAECCAVIVEPLLQGSAGMRIYPAEYLTKLRALCDAYNVLLIADEIATGFGRTGKMFAFDHAAVSPDIMCISKGLTGGYMPMAITVVTDKIYSAFYADYREGARLHAQPHIQRQPARLRRGARRAEDTARGKNNRKSRAARRISEQSAERNLRRHPNVGEIRHIGLINAIELVEDKKTKKPFSGEKRLGYAIYKEALKRGLILRPLGDVIYFNPPLIINEQEIDEAVSRARDALRAVLG